MPRARGSSLRVVAKTESAYGTAPSGNWPQLPVFTFGLSATQPLQQDNVLSTNATRDAADPNQDVLTVAGDVRVPIDLENFGHWLYLLFGAATVTGSSPDYIHTWKSGAVTLPSKSIEKGLLDISQNFLYNGVKANTLAVDFSPSGAADATIGLMGQNESFGGLGAGGTPTFAGMTRFRRNEGSVTKDGSSLANVVGGTFTFSNGLDPVRTIRSDLKLDGIDEGQATLSGSVTLRLSDASLISDAISQTPRALTFGYTLASNQSLIFTLPRVMLSRPGVPITGPAGIEMQVQFIGAHDATAGCMLQAVLKNQIAAYA